MKNKTKNNHGMALMTGLLFIAIAAIILTALSLRVVNQKNSVDRYVAFKHCFNGIEVAITQSITEKNDLSDGEVGLGAWVPADPEELPDFDDEALNPQTLTNLPNVQYFAYAREWETDDIDNNNNGLKDINDPTEDGYTTIFAFAENKVFGDAPGVRRSVEVVVGGANVNVWQNAVFAGAGAAGGAINGNVSIHGSVHILGDNILPGEEALVIMEMGGASLIHNNYTSTNTLPSRLGDSVPALPTTTFNGQVVNTLNASLRVKQGTVSMSGNSEIGEADDDSNTWKETMDGTFVEDGWTGNSVTEDGDRGDPTLVSSDNGWDETYDLGNKVEFPWLTDDWQDPDTGTTVPSPDGDPYAHNEYFSDVLSGTAYEGDITIRTNQDFYYNATDPTNTDPATRQPDDDFIYYDSGTNVLEVNGQIEVNGNFSMSGQGQNDTIYYSGRTALLVNGNVTLDTNLLSCNNGDPNNYANSFPEANVFGIMAEGDITMGSSSQLELMGAFYAQGVIESTKQTRVMGTFVANQFNMGNQVPDIYQVPELANNLPLGMAGNFPILVFTPISWREL